MFGRIADVAAPPRCWELIHVGALVAINHSGGKDSQAMTVLRPCFVIIALRRGRGTPNATEFLDSLLRHQQQAKRFVFIPQAD